MGLCPQTKKKNMDIGLLSVLRTPVVDFHRGLANAYAKALKEAMDLHERKGEKKENYFLSVKRGLEDKLYIGNIHRIESHLYWNDEELADDDQIINVVWVDGPITRDGGACSYGTKDMRDQVMYANTIPQVVGHLFYINTPGGEASARNDYEMMIDDSRKNGKVTVAFVDGLCASSGVNLASRCDRVVVMNQHDEYGCIGSMAAFWATPDGAIDRDGSRYVEIVGDDSPEKNAWWREAAKGEYEKLRALINKSTQEFHQSVRENRPLVKDWMLTGEIFEAKDVIPALVDEIGDYNRAIECVFALANEEMQAARFVVEEPEDGHDDDAANGTEPDEMAKLNAEQKAAINTSKGNLMMAQDGHVTTSVDTIFGPEEIEVATPQNDRNMTEEEKKTAEAQEAQSGEAAEAQQPTEQAPAQEKAIDQDAAEQEEQEAQEEQPAVESPATEAPAAEDNGGKQSAEQNADDDAQTELSKLTETLHNAEALVEQKDKEIAELKDTLATLDGIAEERDEAVKKCKDAYHSLDELGKKLTESEAKVAEHVATIEKLTKQVAELKADVKELSGKETPMLDSAAGIPAGNGTGQAPKVQKRLTRENMSYEHVREVARERQAEREAAKNK